MWAGHNRHQLILEDSRNIFGAGTNPWGPASETSQEGLGGLDGVLFDAPGWAPGDPFVKVRIKLV